MTAFAEFAGALTIATAILWAAFRRRLRARTAEYCQAMRLLAESQEQLQLALDGADEALWDWKIQENQTWYSERWSGMLGYAPNEIGDSVEIWERLVHPEDVAGATAKLNAHLAGETANYQAEFRMKAKDGAWRWIQARGRVVARLADGVPARVAGTHLDITHNKLIADQLSEARNRALEASRAKSAFLANMSHEIRTPMNGIIGTSELLCESAHDEQQREYADIIRTSSVALLTILNDILDFSRIEAGKMRVEREPFHLRDAVRQSLELFSVAASRKGLSLTFEFAEGTPDWVAGDSGRLRQVLVNLIGNAMKFTESGGVTVRCSGCAEFEIVDSGPGITPETLQTLFQPFTQADDSITRRHGGAGLGLAISRQLVELMGGRIEASSVPGSGSVFRFSLPMPKTAAPAVKQREAAIAPTAAAWILLAEDNPVNQKVAVHMLRRLGHRTEVVSTGCGAVEMARTGNFDAILMDCQMPEMSGYEATRLLRLHFGSGPRPRIIALTANSLESDRDACLQAGMDDYLVKPITLAALAAGLQRNGVGLAQAETPEAALIS
jgi:PAS domain S-box-containing protein